MTYQTTIPAEKVRELAAKYDGDSSGDPERLLADLLHDLHGLSAPPQPTTGLLGRWAKHPEHGDVLCMWDKPSRFGKMRVAHVSEGKTSGAEHWYAEFDSLTFPHQTTRPEDVPAGEAWLVDVEHSKESHKAIVALKDAHNDWRTSDEVTNCIFWGDWEVTLIAPLTPERPGKDDLEAKYDALDAKYREAQARIKTLEQPKPAWRIEHDPDNLRVGEYIIDIGGDDGTLARKWGSYWDVDGDAYVAPCFAPFIVFPNVDAATPEAILEAKKARDKEMEK